MVKRKVLMVCFGNTCRSPIAEAIFKNYIIVNNLQNCWEVNSAALHGYHVGTGINARAKEVLEKNGIADYTHVAQIIKVDDFYNYDWIFGMDYYNIELLSSMKPQDSKAEIELLGQYDPEGETIIEDPYFDSNIERFEKAYHQCSRCIPAFINKF